MKEFLYDWRYVIIFLVAFIIFALFEWGKVKEMALQGALMAKKLAKEAILQGGQAQEDWVVCKMYPLLPAAARVVISEALFRKIVRYLYGKACDYLDDGVLNDSYTCKNDANTPKS